MPALLIRPLASNIAAMPRTFAGLLLQHAPAMVALLPVVRVAHHGAVLQKGS
jgi:hypothetical protein